mmetsp:Transcript_9429/g.22235  ORF Transcript_9429/g.22235 Transcript_9429/m.22235 type:complete len:476 (+) Transcript_9429:45-1472(+)|eukprot:CAMPEP_0171105798 /NCGR_PEP_ID=MMETSP0766_2-20121228/63473_1 /TAXON_ID=439317 /ORGANISM="Gambierdiscus australes, Strain CAWD 149" /LENGTH=475 /DNA_ID=CAMNT_0011566745 /DNA_START=45 /DNA_END=1472 /DNA_ORIENTATION=-
MDLDELDELDPVEEIDLSTQEREYGIIIYGATGYTGSLMVEHLDALVARPGAKPLKWAIAGRDLTKLRRIARRCKTAPGVIMVREPVHMAQMVAQARVVAAAAGPYTLCGEDVIAQCINQVTHYIDVSGEVSWISKMIAKYHDRAKERGVMIVHAAGAIAAPDELLSYELVKKLGPLKQYREYFMQYGAMSGGTFNTSIASLESMTEEDFVVSRDPFALGGLRECGMRDVDGDLLQTAPDTLYPSLWQTPAYNTGTGSRIIRRTCQLFEEMPSLGVEYGKEISVVIRDLASNQRSAEQIVFGALPLPNVDVSSESARQMKMSRDRGEQPKPGDGAPPQTRSIYFSEVYGVAESEGGEWAYAHYTSGEAYEVTAMASITGAMVMVEELDLVRPKERAGVITPAYAFHGSTWKERLTECRFACGENTCQISIEVKDGKPDVEEVSKAMKEKTKRAMMGQAQIMKGELKNWSQPALTM